MFTDTVHRSPLIRRGPTMLPEGFNISATIQRTLVPRYGEKAAVQEHCTYSRLDSRKPIREPLWTGP